MDINQAQRNEQGQIAMCYYLTTDPVINITPEVGYVFRTHANICMAWINEEHAQRLLDMRGGCCGGKRPIIRLASELDVERWTQAVQG